jgi:undecaprenyl-diphosphatase
MSTEPGSAAPGIQPPPETRPRSWRTVVRDAVREAAAEDVAVYDAIAAARTPTLDGTLSTLSRAADRSVLWIGVAGALALTGGPSGRRAARDGLVAIGLASATVNLGLKRVATRERPLRDEVALAQDRWVRMPSSDSFPSGHTASAVAVATAVGGRRPRQARPRRGLARVVGYSRVHTGVHYPGDVAAGAAVGSACGFAVANAARARDRARAASA